jgi:hypothetical protein
MSDDALGVGWALCTLLFFSPIVRWYMLTWLLPAFWVCLLEAFRIGRAGWTLRHWWTWAPLAALALILAVSLVSSVVAMTSATIVALCLLNGALYLGKGYSRRTNPTSALARDNSVLLAQKG